MKTDDVLKKLAKGNFSLDTENDSSHSDLTTQVALIPTRPEVIPGTLIGDRWLALDETSVLGLESRLESATRFLKI